MNSIVRTRAAITPILPQNERAGARSTTRPRSLRKATLFTAVSSADLVVRLPLLLVITNLLGGKWFWANIAAIFLTFGARFIISEKKIWTKTAMQAKV